MRIGTITPAATLTMGIIFLIKIFWTILWMKFHFI